MAMVRQVEQVVALLALALLAVGCFYVLQPFLSAILWAIILCFSTWPAYAWLLRHVRSVTVATIAMTLLIASIFLVPFLLIGHSLAQDIVIAAATLDQLLAEGPPAPPDWLRDLPMAGSAVYDYWVSVQSDS